MFKKFLAICGILLLISSVTLAKEQKDISFKDTLASFRQALIVKDYKTVHKHLALKSIIKNKVLRLGKIFMPISYLSAIAIRFSEPAVTRQIYNFTMKNYRIAPRAEIKSYLRHLKMNVFAEKGNRASASGTFMYKPATLYAKKIKGKWVIVDISSNVLNEEIRSLIRAFLSK